MPGTPVPFRWISELPVRAQKEIERNFLHIQGEIVSGSTSVFDAIIDPSLAQNNAAAHQYQNLTSLLSGESWTNTKLFVVGVVGRPGTAILETGAMSLPGPLAMMVMGLASQNVANAFGKSRMVWDLNGHQVTTAQTGANLSLVNLQIQSSASLTSAMPFSGWDIVYMDNCLVYGQDPVTGGTDRIRQITSGNLHARNTGFIDTQASGTRSFLQNCTYSFFDSSTAFTPGSAGDFYMVGGYIAIPFNANPAFTISGANRVYIEAQCAVNAADSFTSITNVMTINATGDTYLDLHGDWENLFGLTVAASAGNVTVKGNVYRFLIVSGNSSGKQRSFDISASNSGSAGGAVLDVTGPALVRFHGLPIGGPGTGSIKLRGSGIRADVQIKPNDTTGAVQLIGCTDSMITANVVAPGGVGFKAFAIDGASARCVLVIGGANNSNFSVASTNAGAACRVITEVGDSLGTIGSPGGFIDYSQVFMQS